MLESIAIGLLFIVAFVARIVFSRPFRKAVDRAVFEETVVNMADNLELYEKMKAARARGEDIKPPSAFR